MVTVDSFDAFLFNASRALCSPLAVFIQIQGCLIVLILALGWALAAYVSFWFLFAGAGRFDG